MRGVPGRPGGGTASVRSVRLLRTGGRVVAAVALLLVAACGGTGRRPGARADRRGVTGARVAARVPRRPLGRSAGAPRVLASGLDVPWGIAFLPDGNALVTERRSARLLRVGADGTVTPVGGRGRRRPGAGRAGCSASPSRPVSPTDRAVFVAYTSATDNRVVRLRAPDGRRRGGAAGRRRRDPQGRHPRRRRPRVRPRRAASTSPPARPGGAAARRTRASAARSCA